MSEKSEKTHGWSPRRRTVVGAIATTAALAGAIAGTKATEKYIHAKHRFQKITEKYAGQPGGYLAMLESTVPDEQEEILTIRKVVAACLVYGNGAALPEIRGMTGIEAQRHNDPLHLVLRALTAPGCELLYERDESGDMTIVSPSQNLMHMLAVTSEGMPLLHAQFQTYTERTTE